MKNSSYYIAPVGVRTHDLPHTVASNMGKVSHALTHSATVGHQILFSCSIICLLFFLCECVLKVCDLTIICCIISHYSGLDIGLVGPVARGASRFENLLAPQKTYWPGGPVDLKTYWPPQKTYWPPKKLTGPYLKTKLALRKTMCIDLQFTHRPIIKLFRSHPRKKFQI